jgi:DNA-binding XRE family transcriptional regulator
MRYKIKIPKILKINWINNHTISVVFNNGESRSLDLFKIFDNLGIDEDSPAYILYQPNELLNVELNNNTLSWPNVQQYITSKEGSKIHLPFEIGADILFSQSQLEPNETSLKIGKLLKDARRESGLTQEALAQKSGTTRNYISRIENDRSDLEIATLKKIIEIGLGKRLEIRIK